jgi:hypothetical protein
VPKCLFNICFDKLAPRVRHVADLDFEVCKSAANGVLHDNEALVAEP